MTGPGRGRWRRAHDRLRAEPEAGTSLVELIVAMILMTICGAIFTAAVVTLFRAANTAQAISASSLQNNQAFQRLDRTIRYASALSVPGTGTSGDWYVESQNATTGTSLCSQLRVDITTQQLQLRTWNPSSVNSTLTSWVPLASSITNGAAASGSTNQPFVASALSNGRPTLKVTLLSLSGPASRQVTSRSSFSIAADNSSVGDAASSTVCQGAGRP